LNLDESDHFFHTDNAGLRRARRKGRQLGRPRVTVPDKRIAELMR
jgi:hypothetical protein